ncbi:MAG: hypothetical protein GY756_07760 [bacterium]|nr:hypothetical protein [bacterium]
MNTLKKKDVEIIRSLAARVAEIAVLPVQDEKRKLWCKLNKLNPARPMVMIDQVCWNEMNINDELTLQCTDTECRNYEEDLRRTLFQWKHFPVDMVVETFIKIPKAIHNTEFGIDVLEETAETDPENDIVGHKFENQFQTEDDLQKIKTPIITHNTIETDRRLSVAHELFDGLLKIVPWGVNPYLSLWDPIATWMGIENVLYTIIDKPEFIHSILNSMTEGYLSMLDQLEEQGLLCQPQSLIHCTGAWSEELPASGYNPEKPRTKDIWMYGLAQMLSTVSPKMFKEFEVDYTKRICERFGLVYYGCCEPLDGRMNEVRMLPNVRKISMSPWANEERGAAEIGKDYVYSRKPNPALLAMDNFNSDQIRTDLLKTKKVCEENKCPLEFILKDLSTVRYQPERIFNWAKIASEIVNS